LVIAVVDDEAGGLGWLEPGRRHVEQRLQHIVGQGVSGELTVVLDAEEQHATFGVGEARDVLGYLIAHGAPVARALPSRPSLEQRLPFEVLALVLGQEGGDVEGVSGAGQREAPVRG